MGCSWGESVKRTSYKKKMSSCWKLAWFDQPCKWQQDDSRAFSRSRQHSATNTKLTRSCWISSRKLFGHIWFLIIRVLEESESWDWTWSSLDHFDTDLGRTPRPSAAWCNLETMLLDTLSIRVMIMKRSISAWECWMRRAPAWAESLIISCGHGSLRNAKINHWCCFTMYVLWNRTGFFGKQDDCAKKRMLSFNVGIIQLAISRAGQHFLELYGKYVFPRLLCMMYDSTPPRKWPPAPLSRDR